MLAAVSSSARGGRSSAATTNGRDRMDSRSVGNPNSILNGQAMNARERRERAAAHEGANPGTRNPGTRNP
jgi:hypothetical protein